MNCYTNAIGTTLAIVLGILLVCMLIPAQQEDVSRTVTQGACGAQSPDDLCSLFELEVAAIGDELDALMVLGFLDGSLWYFEPGTIVYPTGRVEQYTMKHYSVSGTTIRVIQVTSPSVFGAWWIFEMQTE